MRRRIRWTDARITYVAYIVAGCVDGVLGFAVLYALASMLSM